MQQRRRIDLPADANRDDGCGRRRWRDRRDDPPDDSADRTTDDATFNTTQDTAQDTALDRRGQAMPFLSSPPL